MNKILSIIGKILLGILLFSFLYVWYNVYDTMDTSEKGINKIFVSFKQALHLVMVGIVWGFIFIYYFIASKLNSNIKY